MRALLTAARAHVHPFYWTVGDLPAFARLPRRAALRAWWPYVLRSLGHWRPWASAVVVIGAGAAVGYAAAGPVLAHCPAAVDPYVGLTLCVGLAAAVGGGLTGNYWASYTNRLALADHPHLCRRCGYDLSATPARCPECGRVPAGECPR